MGSGFPQTGVELVAANLTGFLDNLKQGNAAVAGFGKGMEDGSHQTKSASDFMVGALQQIGTVAVDALLKAGQAIVGFAKDSIKVAGDFQAGMQQFQAVAGQDVNAKGLQQFHDLFIQLGKDLPVSTSDVQQAAIEMVKGGIDPAIIAAGGLKQNIQFAAAAMGGDLVAAATISSKVLGGWADINATSTEKAAFLAKATDLLTKAANASSVDVHELSLGIFNAQGTAKAAGVSFEDLTTTLAEMAPRFASASEGGNALKNVIVRLQPTTKPAIAAFQELGLMSTSTTKIMAFLQAQGIKPLGKDLDTLGNQFTALAASQGMTQKETDKIWQTFQQSSFFDTVTGKFVGFQKASELLKTSLAGLTDAQRVQQLQTMFGSDGMNAAAALTELGAAGYQKMADALLKANGVQANAELVQQGFNTSMENTKGSIEALQITIGEKLLPVLGMVMDTYIAPGINTLTSFAGAVFGSKEAFDKLPESLQPVAEYVKDVVSGFSKWSDGTLSLKTALDIVSPGLGDLVENFQKLGKFLLDNIETIKAVGVAFVAFGVITTVSASITGLIGTVTAMGAAFAEAGGGISAVVAILGGPITLVIAAVAAAIGVLYLAWTNDWGGIQEKVAEAWKYVQPVFTQLGNWLSVNIPKGLQILANYWTGTLQPALVQVGGYIEKNIFPILKFLADVVIAAAILELKLMAGIWTTVLQPALIVVWNVLKDDIIPIISALVNIHMAVLQKVTEALAGIWQKVLQPALKTVGDYISANLGPTLKDIGNWLSTTFGPTLQNISKWLGDATGGFKGMGDAVQGVIKWLKDLGTSISNLKLPPWLTPGSPTPWEIALRGIGDALQTEVVPNVDAFTTSLESMGPAANAAGNDITKQLGTALQGAPIIRDAKDLGTKAIAGLVAGIESSMKSIDKVANKVAKHTADAFGTGFQAASPSQLIVPYGVSVVTGLIKGISDAMPALTHLVDDLGARLNAQFTKISSETGRQIADMVQLIQDKVASVKGALADLQIAGYTSTASIDLQKVSNLGALDNLTNMNKQRAQQALMDAESEARVINDPQQAADYYRMRSEQIFKLAQLQERVDNDLTTAQRAQLDANVAQYQRDISTLTSQQNDVKKQLAAAIKDQDAAQMAALQSQSDYLTSQIDHWQEGLASAQDRIKGDLTDNQVLALRNQQLILQDAEFAQRKAFEAKSVQGSQTTDVITQLREVLDAKIQVKGKTVELPGLLEDATIKFLYSVFDKLTAQSAPVWNIAPPMASTQYAPGGAGGGYVDSRQTNFNLGVTTNNSPAALQQSFALMQSINQ